MRWGKETGGRVVGRDSEVIDDGKTERDGYGKRQNERDIRQGYTAGLYGQAIRQGYTAESYANVIQQDNTA